MSMLACYKNLEMEKWKYYYALDESEKDKVLSCFDAPHCKKFIAKNFSCGGKEEAFDISFSKEYLESGKHEHTVSLYFLGCCFQEFVNGSLKDYLGRYIPKVEQWYDFCYTWYLACLYHDTAAPVEEKNWYLGCPSDLDFYLSNENVEYNVFGHDWGDLAKKPYTYDEQLIKNYFKYRVEYWHSVDHGIIAGFVLYDRLVKNYNKAWAHYSSQNRDTTSSKENFEYKNLKWRTEQISHFAIVADAIIAHNIWVSGSEDDKVKVYKQYGLDPLISISENREKLTLEGNPLVFYLDLLDTIEPVKFFQKRLCSSQQILNIIEISKQKNGLNIRATKNISGYVDWCNNIRATKDWLDVTILSSGNRKNVPKNLVVIAFSDH